MNTLNGYSKSTLTDKYVLTAAGGHLAVGNAKNNIPLNNGTVNTSLNADLLDGKHASSFYEKTAADGKFILFSKVSKSTVEGTNNAPQLYNIENEELISGYKKYWYVFNMGSYSGGNYRTQIAMPYLSDLTDTELFVRSDKGGSWRSWRRVLHDGNYSGILDSRYYTETEVNNKLAGYLPLSGGTMTGKITMNAGTGILMKYTAKGNDPWIYPNGAVNYGIRYFEGDPDKIAFSATGNNNNTSSADLCINGNGEGTVTIRGKNILTEATAPFVKKLYSRNDNEYYVILLCKYGTGLTGIGHRVSGKIYSEGGGINRYVAADIDIWIADWSSSYESKLRFDTYGVLEMDLVTCTYEGTKYLAIRIKGAQAKTVYFEGTSTAILFTPIYYYNSNTGSVINSEINGSITSITVNLPYSNGNKYALVSDNVASATKLQTARTIWGQSFNGTANVDGTLHLKASGNSYTQGIRIYLNGTGYSGILLGSKDLTSTTSTDSKSWFVSTNTDAYFSISKGGYLPTDSTSFGYDGTNWRANNKIILTEGNYKSYVDNLYWANLPIQQATDATTHPTFGNATVSGTIKARDVIINGGTGSNIETRAVLVLNSPSGKAADIVFKCNSTSTGSYGQWAISSRSDNNYRLGIWRGSENGSTASEKEVFTILANGNVGVNVNNPSSKFLVNGSIRVLYNTPWLYIKDTNTAANTYSILSFGNSSNDNAAYVFLNGPSRTEDGGANKMTIRNNVGSLRLNNDTEVTGLLTTSYGNTHKGIKIGNSYINAIDKDIIFQNNNSIRFGGDNWDWNAWAGLKYTSSSKTIHLGLADGTVFQANTNQSGGTLNLPGISHITSSYYRIAIGHILQHTHTTTGGWYRVAKLKSYFNFDIHINGGWSTGMPSVIKVNICQINGTAKITQLAGYVGNIASSIRLGKVATNEWDVLFYSSGFSSGTLALQNFTFFGIGDITTYSTSTISTTSYTSTTDLAFTTLTGLSLTSDNYTTYTVTKTGGGASGTWGINITGSAGSVAWGNVTGKPSSFTPSSHSHDYLPLSGGTLTGTLTMYTTGTGSYNHGIRINRVKTSDWALILIGKSGTATSGTGTSTVGDGAWLIGTPASSNSLIFNLNDAKETVGLCLKGHGASDMKWNNNTVWHAGNDGSGSGLDADLLDGNHASAFATSGHNHDSSYVKYAKVSKSTADSTNAKPYIYNIESETVVSGYYGYWYILNLGLYSGGNFGTLLAMPYQDSLTDSELFIRSAKSGSWRTWRRVLHDGNSSVSKSGQTLTVKINGTSQSLTNSTYNFSGVSFTSGNSKSGSQDCNAITSNGHWYYSSNGPSTSIGATTADGALYSLAYSSSWVGQIAQDYRDGDLFTRGRKDGTWTSWKLVAYALDFIKKSGDTLSSGTTQIQRAGSSVSWYLGRSNAMIRINSYSGYNAIASMKTTNGDWSMGVYSDNKLYFSYVLDTHYNAGTNQTTGLVVFAPNAYIYAGHFYEHSDIRLKNNISNILTSDNIPQLKKFNWNHDDSIGYGLIAQDLEEMGYPELVSIKDDGYKTVDYSAALSLIVGKLQVKIKELEKEIENLKNKN